jgi:hypothetical protein
MRDWLCLFADDKPNEKPKRADRHFLSRILLRNGMQVTTSGRGGASLESMDKYIDQQSLHWVGAGARYQK